MSVRRESVKLVTITFLMLFLLSSTFTFYWIGISEEKHSPNNFEALTDEKVVFPSKSINYFRNSQDFDSNIISTINAITSENSHLLNIELILQRDSPKSENVDPHALEMEKIGEEIEERVNRVNELCQKYHLGKYKHQNGTNDLNAKEPPTPLFSYYFWNRERHLAWCPVYKAGSTSWLYNMMILAGYSQAQLNNPPKQLSFLARDVYGDSEPDTQTLEQSLKLLIVRHPFERLISAYRDKLANASIGQEHGTEHFYSKYGAKIVRKYRKDKSIVQKEPTWEEFIRYLISTNLIHYSDDHWLPAYYSCTPCLVDYDIIAKMETYSRDQEFIIYKGGLEGILKPRWNHQDKSTQYQTQREEIIRKYFSQLTKFQIKQLYNKYWFDFKLFGYDYQDYFKYGIGYAKYEE